MSNLTARLDPLQPPYLYCLADTSYGIENIPSMVTQALAGGARIFQLRAKNTPQDTLVELGQSIKQQIKDAGDDALLIINDHPDLAKQVAADGVHLGAQDMSPQMARQILGKSGIIGVTIHNIGEAQDIFDAQSDNADNIDCIDYVGIGPVFSSSTKNDLPPLNPHIDPHDLLELIKSVRSLSDCPIICIGGIDENNMQQLQEYKIDGIAMAAAIANPATTMSSCQNIIHQLNSWK